MTSRLFGNPPIAPIELCGRFVPGVRRRTGLDENSNVLWTNAVRDELREIGNGFSLETYPGDCNGVWHPECLLDAVWYSTRTGGMVLAAESEWTESGVLEDFKKLRYVKSPLKLMVYWVERHERWGARIRDEICNCLLNFDLHIAGEEYMLVEFGRGHDDNCYDMP